MELDDVISLATAAELLGLSPDTLKRQAQNSRIDARLVGKTWITTRQEVARYAAEQRGRVGRPPAPTLFGRIPWPSNMYPGTVELHLLAKGLDPDASKREIAEARRQQALVEELARKAIAEGAWTMAEVLAPIRSDPRMRDIPVGFTDTPSWALVLGGPGHTKWSTIKRAKGVDD